MKAFISIAVVCLIASALAGPFELTEEQKAKAKVYFDECVKEENVSEADANRLRNKDFSNASANMKCFGSCSFEKIGALKDGQIQEAIFLEKLAGFIGEDNSKTVLSKCKDVKGEDRCDSGYKLYECVSRESALLVTA